MLLLPWQTCPAARDARCAQLTTDARDNTFEQPFCKLKAQEGCKLGVRSTWLTLP